MCILYLMCAQGSLFLPFQCSNYDFYTIIVFSAILKKKKKNAGFANK